MANDAPSTNMARQPSRELSPEPEPPLMHFPHCRLSITPCDSDSMHFSAGKLEQIALPGPLVRTLVARVESLRPRFLQSSLQQQQQSSHPQQTRADGPPLPAAPEAAEPEPAPLHTTQQQQQQQRKISVQTHFDDNDDWVASRCLLADFTGFCEDEAEALSSQGRLCCWASVVLQPVAETGLDAGGGDTTSGGAGASAGGDVKWELGFVVHRVGVRDPGRGWCECF
ncbi:hypothetical protein MMYC01_210480 [Madurella mycetomatis]|uniref:Uncharacterized protein n=1 Tax=Madurella mycetomatis TaxID=100816 RepID=A0A175VPM3_9PEZI|nr:hypothetical protein MMYC01_210480 [Madurella mycetomatis]